MKAGLLAFGALIWAAPLARAGRADPLAPLPQPERPRKPVAGPAAGASRRSGSATRAGRSAPPASPTVAVPKDWRGVFDAIDAGNWASAQAGIAALPASILTPVAKAELYTAKGSPAVDLASLQALIAEAPELPQADQLAPMAIKRGATTPPLIVPEKADREPRLGARPLSRQAGPGRARRRPAARRCSIR